ncbi:MAG: Ig domain-containing protein [Anaerorhabdus sp.]
MRQVFRLSIKSLIAVLCCLSIFAGCQAEKKEILTLGEWISYIVEKVEIPDALESSPYFLNIPADNNNFAVIQAAVEWGVIGLDKHLNPDDTLTKEWAAYTLMNLYPAAESNQKITDLAKSQFPDQVASSVSFGILELDSRGCFNPKEELEKEKALQLLDAMVEYVNNWIPTEEKNEIVFTEDMMWVTKEPFEFDEINKIARFESASIYFEAGDYIYLDSDGTQIYKVISLAPSGDVTDVYLDVAQASDVIEEMDVESSFEINFDEIFFESDGIFIEEEDMEDEISFSNPFFQKLSTKEMTVQGLNIAISTTSAGIKAKISRNLAQGGIINAELNLYDVNPVVKWKAKNFNIEEAYFKLNYSTSAELSVQKGRNKHIYSDFSFLNSDQLLAAIPNSFNNDLSYVNATIDLAEFSVPIPNVPLMKVKAKLQLYLYANGKMELALANNFGVGAEIKNNKLRFFYDHNDKQTFSLRSSAGIVATLSAGLDIFNTMLMDISLQSGIRGKVETSVQVRDEPYPRMTEIAYDSLENISKSNKNIKACGEISAYWVMDVVLNSEKTLANKLGWSLKKSLLREKNANLIPKNMRFIENGKLVEQCFKESNVLEEMDYPNLMSDKIELKDYQKILHKGDVSQLEIVSLPNGYRDTDLFFSSNNDMVATINEKNEISAKVAGSAIITVQTMDHKYQVNCHILVTDVDNEKRLLP